SVANTWDATTNKNILSLHPNVQAPATAFINDAAQQGMNLRIYFGYRSVDQQNALYNAGKTPAKGGHSYHNYGLAIDLVQISNKKALWKNQNWSQIGALGMKHGFGWGGDWASRDMVHFQMPFGLSIKDLLSGKRP
ncbi:MAG: peptidase M15, partial [Chitinivibrionales bacterium]|nr:peptidase M15 [Chitinivibrionales bacterium]